MYTNAAAAAAAAGVPVDWQGIQAFNSKNIRNICIFQGP
jgi:hypothetical protein